MCTLNQKTQHLLILAKEGDKTALNQLYRIYAERVRWMVHFRMSNELRSQFESMDLVQNTLINAFNALDNFTYTNEGDLVLDNCVGSGTTAVAAIKEKRRFIGMELNKEFYDIACERIKQEQSEIKNSLFNI